MAELLPVEIFHCYTCGAPATSWLVGRNKMRLGTFCAQHATGVLEFQNELERDETFPATDRR